MKISLIEKVECIKSGYWSWRCEVEMDDGEIRTGYIMSDGHSHAMESLELDMTPEEISMENDLKREFFFKD